MILAMQITLAQGSVKPPEAASERKYAFLLDLLGFSMVPLASASVHKTKSQTG